ncbi:hypothetical protein CLHUN_27620 [Ruminiclostridium hungatei]|uniref:YcxB-like C-terminal domain-containing protein n=1 Tax=Ruminiclostridium hungatei TaxID=48256 RepID=A0A1V4SJI8_RUMHU|nr:YcxB family protein [Ruminiclostridium hungatei]OPX43417.1 hypothetical protein CLHUN_27620 [Ruminiclostridium hungatei]
MDNGDSKMVFKSKLEKEDYLKACKVILKMKRKERKLLVFVLAYILLFFAILIVTYLGSSGGKVASVSHQSYVSNPAPWYIANLPTISFAIIFAVLVIIFKYARNANKRHYESNKLIQNEMEFTLDNSGIEYRSERVYSKINWDEIFKVYISKDFFFIFISDRTMWVIPKKYIGIDELSKVVHYFTTYVNKKKVRFANY